MRDSCHNRQYTIRELLNYGPIVFLRVLMLIFATISLLDYIYIIENNRLNWFSVWLLTWPYSLLLFHQSSNNYPCHDYSDASHYLAPYSRIYRHNPTANSAGLLWLNILVASRSHMRTRTISAVIICAYPFVTYAFTASSTTSKEFSFVHYIIKTLLVF